MAILSAMYSQVLWTVHVPRKTHIVYTSEVFLVAPAVLLYQQPSRAELEQRSAPLRGSNVVVSRHSCRYGVEVGWRVMLTPKGSKTLRFPCIRANSSLKVRVPSPLLSYFANMSSNCCGRKRPSLSYVSLSDPCYTPSRKRVSPRTGAKFVCYHRSDNSRNRWG